ncbi:MAG: serine hydrolase domain-containing protein [Ilumatobacteraceae bacterium]
MPGHQRERVADALSLTRRWQVDTVAAAVVLPGGSTVALGPTARTFRLASISKMLVGWAALIAAEEGTIDLDAPLGEVGGTDLAGASCRHLLAHASGLAFDTGYRLAAPGTRRIYSNTGIELLAAHLAGAAAMPFGDYLAEAVLEPLGMSSTELRGSPAKDIAGTVDDLVRFVAELQQPRLVSADSALDFRSVQFAGLPGVLPGIGRFDDCTWGLGAEVRGTKQPHWTGTRNSPSTYGHFGGAGTLLWVDPAAATACIALTDRPFDEWASEALVLWPALADAVLSAVDTAPATATATTTAPSPWSPDGSGAPSPDADAPEPLRRAADATIRPVTA